MRNLILPLIAAFSQPAIAADLRCQGNIVASGMEEDRLLDLCSHPIATEESLRKFVRYDKDRQIFEAKRIRHHLIDDGSRSYLFLVEISQKKIAAVKQVYLNRETTLSTCMNLALGLQKIVFHKFCGSPTEEISSREEIPKESKFKNSQPVRLIDEVVYEIGSESWKLTFVNDALVLKTKL